MITNTAEYSKFKQTNLKASKIANISYRFESYSNNAIPKTSSIISNLTWKSSNVSQVIVPQSVLSYQSPHSKYSIVINDSNFIKPSLQIGRNTTWK